jgi:hypothetical protein
VSQHQIIGAAEIVDFPEFNWLKVKARIDTGARTSAMHCTKITLQKTEKGEFLHFWLQPDDSGQARSFTTSDFEEKEVKSSFGTTERRFTIKALVVISHKRIRGKFTLTNREKMSYPILIGRNFLRSRFLVDVSRNNLKAD